MDGCHLDLSYRFGEAGEKGVDSMFRSGRIRMRNGYITHSSEAIENNGLVWPGWRATATTVAQRYRVDLQGTTIRSNAAATATSDSGWTFHLEGGAPEGHNLRDLMIQDNVSFFTVLNQAPYIGITFGNGNSTDGAAQTARSHVRLSAQPTGFRTAVWDGYFNCNFTTNDNVQAHFSTTISTANVPAAITLTNRLPIFLVDLNVTDPNVLSDGVLVSSSADRPAMYVTGRGFNPTFVNDLNVNDIIRDVSVDFERRINADLTTTDLNETVWIGQLLDPVLMGADKTTAIPNLTGNIATYQATTPVTDSSRTTGGTKRGAFVIQTASQDTVQGSNRLAVQRTEAYGPYAVYSYESNCFAGTDAGGTADGRVISISP